MQLILRRDTTYSDHHGLPYKGGFTDKRGFAHFGGFAFDDSFRTFFLWRARQSKLGSGV